MKLPFVTLDVFTRARFAGNPLAVVLDADGLDATVMQSIAREFGHPETVFVLTPSAAGNTARARIFTPAVEMPFAGHPTVGTAVALTLRRGTGADVLIEEQIGVLNCRVALEGVDRGYASFVVPSPPVETGPPASDEAIAAALGLGTGDIGFDGHGPSKWTLGNSFTLVPVHGIDAVRRCTVDDARWDAAFESPDRSFAFVFCADPVDRANSFHARMFAPRAGVREDPATGSAAAAFCGFCAQSLKLGDGEHRFVIEQGFEMGRPSLIALELTLLDDRLSSASVGGPAIIVTEGTVEA
jgi:trans-2,3-dihydro-3-hydroxyanthranilate isomerase